MKRQTYKLAMAKAVRPEEEAFWRLPTTHRQSTRLRAVLRKNMLPRSSLKARPGTRSLSFLRLVTLQT